MSETNKRCTRVCNESIGTNGTRVLTILIPFEKFIIEACFDENDMKVVKKAIGTCRKLR